MNAILLNNNYNDKPPLSFFCIDSSFYELSGAGVIMPGQRNGKRVKTLVGAMHSNALDLAISEVVRASKSNGGRAPNGLYQTTVSGLV